MKYKSNDAKKYWENRILENDNSLNRVLYYSESEMINSLYDKWEKKLIRKLIGEVENSIILDVPVGIGRWTDELHKGENKVYCVDISEEILNEARKNCHSKNDDIKYICSPVRSMNFNDNSFDYILCTGLFEHLPEDEYLYVIDLFQKVLKPGGRLVLVVNNIKSKFLNQVNDNPNRINKQLDNGYFNALTDFSKIVNRLKSNNIKIENYSINPCFSLLRQILKNINYNEQIKTICDNAIDIDIKYFSEVSEPLNCFSDQIVLTCRKY